MLGVPVLCLGVCETVLKNIRKKIFKNLTETLMFPYRSDVAESTRRWYCCGCELFSNIVTAFEYHI